mgnify:CR=1 FL=1
MLYYWGVRLLFITQKIDKEDDILGVYHEWAGRLAEKVAELNIICLSKGVADLPLNVRVWSLGKEKGQSKLGYLLNFYRYIFKLRDNYDLVFVHMNPPYILLGWFWWKLWRKKIVYWNASYKINWLMKFALSLADKGVTSVPEAFNIRSKKIIAVGQGIDTDSFRRINAIEKRNGSILYLGRISPVKNLEILIKALGILARKDLGVNLSVVGEVREGDKYHQKILRESERLGQAGIISFLGKVPNYRTPELYNFHQLFVNLTESGSFDKSILEAMACQTLVLVSNKIYERIFPGDLKNLLMFKEKNAVDLALKLGGLLRLSGQESEAIGKRLREIVVRDHNLNNLSSRLISVFNTLL